MALRVLSWLLLAAAAACAGHAAIDVTLPMPPVSADAPAVRIGRVEDARVFGPRSLDDRTMSLAPGLADESGVTARVIGRRRAASGAPQDNVLLREGRSVADLVAEATELGLRQAGYRVAARNDLGAPALDLVIRRFWIRMVYGALLEYELRAEVHVRGPVPPFGAGAWVCGNADVARAGPSADVWPRTLEVGLEDYARNLADRLTNRRLPPHCGRLTGPAGILPDASATMPPKRE